MSFLKLATNFEQHNINYDVMDYQSSITDVHHFLETVGEELNGWVNDPISMKDSIIFEILNLSNEIKKSANVLVIIGIGGSYLGAKAIIQALSPYFKSTAEVMDVVFVGTSFSGRYMKDVLEKLKNKEFYVNVVSKSGSTLESSIAFRILRQYTEQRYGQDAHRRIIVTTDAEKGVLNEIATMRGYRQLAIPANIGGRYSVLTPVGLLPIAIAGVDIVSLLEGAKKAAWDYKEESIEDNAAYRYAMYRHALYGLGYRVELLASFEPCLSDMHEWWKQLFGESEGKDKMGLFPAAATYSTDLHSIGQFVQEGNPMLFETLLFINDAGDDFTIPLDEENRDGLNSVCGHSLNELNCFSKDGTFIAHTEGGVPIIEIELQRLDAFHLGYLLYFFMKACAMSAFLLGVNPFDQPGVESYKMKMLELLNGEMTIK